MLISLDTLRPDHLGCYGYARATSPNIDEFASRAMVFRNAFSTAPKTPESHMSMFTSLYPSAHGVGTIMETHEGVQIPVLSSDIRTIAGILKERGYATVGLHSGGFLDAKFGFDRGFDLYRESKLRGAVDWLEQRASDAPFFLFVHTYHVHDPYTPRPPFDSKFAREYSGGIVHDLSRLKELGGSNWVAYSKVFWSFVDRDSPVDAAHLAALYDAEIAELDVNLRKVFDAIERHAPNTVIAVVSDHGEEFGDHGMFIHEQIYDELLRVVLMVKLPGQRDGRAVDEHVSLIDLAPTLLDLLSVPPIDQFEGRAGRWFDTEASAERGAPPVHAVKPGEAATTDPEPPSEMYSEAPVRGYAAIRDGRWKLLSTPKGLELYDYREDPRETENLLTAATAKAAAVVEAFERLEAALRARQSRDRELHRRFYANGETQRLDHQNLEQLRALGYID